MTWLQKLIEPQSLNKNLKQQEQRLNIILLLSIFSFLIINIIQLINWETHIKNHCLSLFYTIFILVFLFILLWLSKKGKIKIASWLLIFIYFLPMCQLFLQKGTGLPFALLLAVLIIVLFGLLIKEQLSLISGALIGVFIITLTYLQNKKILKFSNYWGMERNNISDSLIYVLLLIVISFIAWLFSHNLKQALARAQKSEKKLQEEYQLLEIKALEKSKKLYQAQEEKMLELYRLAKFGRLSSGIFHDLINPLTAISLNLEQITENDDYLLEKNNHQILNVKLCLNQALLATHRMEKMIRGIKKQIQQKSNLNFFLINEEIKETIQILSYKARQAKVKINFISHQKIELYGDAVKFGQIIINLLSNAIEASEEQLKIEGDQNLEKIVEIIINKEKTGINIKVKDQGIGIHPQNIDKIFDNFFSTKTGLGRNLGLGLASVKNIIENNFFGKITVKSQKGQGSVFDVFLPFNI